MIILQACAKNSLGSFCNLYIPIYSSTEDSEITKQQIDANNAVWLEICND